MRRGCICIDRDVIGELKCVMYGKKQGGENVTNGRPSQKAHVYTRIPNRTGMGNNEPNKTRKHQNENQNEHQ